MIDAIGRQLLGMIMVFVLALGPAATAGWLLGSRKNAARERRRSPLTQDLLRTPGHALREELEDKRLDLAFDFAMLTFVPVLPLAFLQVHSLIVGKATPLPTIAIVVLAALALFAWQIRRMLRRRVEMDHLRLGLDAELAVGQELDQLMRQGAAVFHDIPAEKFNIDHVVIAPQGVFAVETKGYSKPNRAQGVADARVEYDGKALRFPDWSTNKPIEQAARQAQWLSRWLASATGEPVAVAPVLALPGWFVDRKGRGDVAVLSGRELRNHLLKSRGAQSLSAEQMQRVVHQVEQRCRDVKSTYRTDDGER